MATGRDRFYFPPPQNVDQQSMQDKVSAIFGQPIGAINTGAADAQSAADSVVVHAASLQGQVNSLNSLFLSRNSRPLASGIVPNGESSIEYVWLTQNPTTVTATPTSLPWGLLRTVSDAQKNLVALPIVSSATSSLSSVYADIYVFNENGSKSYFQSIDILGQLTGGGQWISFDTADLDVGQDATVGLQIRCVGSSGSVVLKALDFTTLGGLPGGAPGNVGMVRTTNNAPTTISAGDGEYMGKAIYFEYGNGESAATAAPPYDYFDGFDTDSGWDWSGQTRTGTQGNGLPEYSPNSGYDLRIQNGRMESTYSGFGAQVGYRGWTKQTRRNDYEFSFRIGQSKSLWSGAVLNHNGTAGYSDNVNGDPMGPAGPFVLVGVKNDTLAIMTAANKGATSFTTRSSVAISAPTSRWIATYTEADNTYRAFREGDSSPLLTWADTDNYIPGRRRVALFNTGQLFSTGSWIDDARLRDTYSI